MSPYIKSKVLAERAAWDWLQAEGQSLEMSVVNPVSRGSGFRAQDKVSAQGRGKGQADVQFCRQRRAHA